MTQTGELLIQHAKAYPALEMQDIFKFIHQSTFGCEHFVTSLEKAGQFIQREYAAGVSHGQIEPLDGEYCRVPLCLLASGLAAETLAKLFVASSQNEEDGQTALQEKLETARKLVKEGLLPFTEAEFDEALAQWAAQGYPAVHHSDSFRQDYRPAYRVIAKKFVPFLPLFAALDRLPKDRQTIVAIDGGSASGKTALGKLLEEIYGCTVFHTDDFFLRPEQRTAERYAEIGGNLDRERLVTEVLQPLSRGETVSYRSFDCHTMTFGEVKQVKPRQLVIVEGAYSMHPEMAKFYDLSVFLDIDPQLQRQRILHRDGSRWAQRFFDEWIPLEQRYFRETGIKTRCTITIAI